MELHGTWGVVSEQQSSATLSPAIPGSQIQSTSVPES